MAKPWFKKTGWFHRPISWEGYFALLFFLLFALYIIIIIGVRRHSFYGVLPYLIPAFFLYEWLAWHKSPKHQ
jgi:hypothetical protein